MKLLVLGAVCGALLAMAGTASAQKYHGGSPVWKGKTQKSFYVDLSTPEACYNTKGGDCGSIALTTGKGYCVGREVSVGGTFDFISNISGLGINFSKANQWTACNERSETIQCSPQVGWKAQAAILIGERFGTTTFNKADNYLVSINQGCAKGYVKRSYLTGLGGAIYRCEFNAPFSTDGFFPEFRYATCKHSKI